MVAGPAQVTQRERARSGQKPMKRPAGPAGDRYVVEARGRSFFVIDADTGGVFGVYPDRRQAEHRADGLQSVSYARFRR
jgi:hypothetical protein